jgi:hypothetical protein
VRAARPLHARFSPASRWARRQVWIHGWCGRPVPSLPQSRISPRGRVRSERAPKAHSNLFGPVPAIVRRLGPRSRTTWNRADRPEPRVPLSTSPRESRSEGEYKPPRMSSAQLSESLHATPLGRSTGLCSRQLHLHLLDLSCSIAKMAPSDSPCLSRVGVLSGIASQDLLRMEQAHLMLCDGPGRCTRSLSTRWTSFVTSALCLKGSDCAENRRMKCAVGQCLRRADD